MRNILFGLAVAVTSAAVLVVANIGAVAIWKVVLGLFGGAVFFLAGRGRFNP